MVQEILQEVILMFVDGNANICSSYPKRYKKILTQ